jgi:hypothetical protein
MSVFAIAMYLVDKFLPEPAQLRVMLAPLFIGVYVCVRRLRVNWRRDHGRGIESESAYAVLGVDSQASHEEIRRAYRDLAGKHHPDSYPAEQKGTATALFLRITRAYEMLGDEDVRFEYDALARYHDPSAPPFDEAYAHITVWRNQRTSDEDIEDWGDEGPEVEADVSSQPEPDVEAQNPKSAGEESIHCAEQARNPAVSGECQACGEPYSIPAGRSGSICCDRCGVELLRT